jgi:uncharacterized protein with GYD domain
VQHDGERRDAMAKYLWRVSYTVEGTKGLLKVGGSNRRRAIEQLLNDVGGSLEAFYYAFGRDDVIAIAEIPDNVTAAAIAMSISAAGAARITTTVLLTPEEIDEVTGRQINYRPPAA